VWAGLSGFPAMSRHLSVYFAGVDGQPILLIIMRDWRKATDFQTTVRKFTRPNLTPITRKPPVDFADDADFSEIFGIGWFSFSMRACLWMSC